MTGLLTYFTSMIIITMIGFGAAIEITFPDGSKETVGHFGILHPEVLGAFALNMPVTVLEMGLGNFVDRKRAAPSK